MPSLSAKVFSTDKAVITEESFRKKWGMVSVILFLVMYGLIQAIIFAISQLKFYEEFIKDGFNALK